LAFVTKELLAVRKSLLTEDLTFQYDFPLQLTAMSLPLFSEGV